MMRTKMLWFMNGIVIFGTVLFLWLTLAEHPGLLAAPQRLPGPAPETVTATGLAFVTYIDGRAGENSNSLATTQIYPVSENGRLLENAQPETLYSQPDPASCETDTLQASPNGMYMTLSYNCEANYYARIVHTSDSNSEPILLPRGVFLDWSPDGAWFLFRDTDEDIIWLVDLLENKRLPLNLPAGTYRAIFTPDGQRILYAASIGLGYGSELGILDMKNSDWTIWQRQPHHIIGTPQWSPDGTLIAYILLPDNNVPYTVGELWLADSAGQPMAMLAHADAGRGYPPVWSPDGRTIAYIHRENPQSNRATFYADALQSNIYQVDVVTGAITPLTNFTNSLVYDPVWSPDGRQLAYTAQDAIWLQTSGQSPIQISPFDVIARHPAWLVSVNDEGGK